MDEKDGKLIYDVVVDAVGLNWEQAGPLFERYKVSLAGRIDRVWVDCYKRLITDLDGYAGFRLDPGASEVSFTTRSTDGPIQVMNILKKLESLVARVNQEARDGDASQRETLRGGLSKARTSGLGARLGFRR